MPKESVPSGILKPNEERRMLRGHLWCYRNEFMTLPALEDGAVFDVFSASRKFVGRAFYQAQGGICGRILSYHQQEIDSNFLKKRLDEALAMRRRLFPDSRIFRWIHGESDGLPGLVMDRYEEMVSVQTSCAFYGERRKVLEELLLACTGVRSISWMQDGTRTEAGASLQSLEMDLDGVRIGLSPALTQKTGLFLDQRENWPLLRRFAKGVSVLDAYCYHGLWGLHAALGGAASVTGVDSSAPALEQAQANAARNGCGDICRFVKSKAEDYLEEMTPCDVIVLDPPAFAKTRGQAKSAFTLYESINAKAMKKLARGGILVSCSCSHFVDRALFLEALKRAAQRADRHTQMLMTRGAAPDHPVLPSMPETEYLKCAVLRVL